MSPVLNLKNEAKVRRRKAIGRLIVSVRGEMTQTELGVKLGDYQQDGEPIPQTTISRWERGTIDMTFEQALEIEMALGVPFGTLARAGGYVAADDSYKGVEETIQVDPFLDPELKGDLLLIVKSYKNVSKRLDHEEFLNRIRRR